MMYRPTTHRRGHDNYLRLAIFPVPIADFVQIEPQFGHTPVNVFFQIL
jgi:hypothetical protein